MPTIRVSHQQKLAALILLFISIVIAGVALFSIVSQDNDDNWESIALSVMTFWAGSFIILTHLYFRSLYLFTMAYLVVLALFHVGLFAQHVIGLTRINEWTGSYNYWIYQSAWHVILAFAGFSGGFALLCLLQKRIAISPKMPVVPACRQQLRSISIGLLVSSCLLLVIAIIQLGNILQFSRFELLYGKHDTRSIGVFTMLFPTALITLAASTKGKSDRVIVLSLSAIAFLVILLSGNRTLAMFPALAGVVIWIKLGHKVPKAVVVGSVLFVLLAIPSISYLRQAKSYEDLSLSDIAKSSQQADIKTAFSELGRTFGILAETLRIVPDEEPYRLGYTYLLYIERSIPNIGASVNSDYSREILLRNIRLQKQEGLLELSPADWASYHIIPEQFLMGGGTGFSAIAEAYFNFGSAGVLIMFAIMGAFFARFDSISLPNNYYVLLFSTLYFWPLLTTVRNEFGIFVKPAIFTTIVVFAWLGAKKFLSGKSRSRIRHAL